MRRNRRRFHALNWAMLPAWRQGILFFVATAFLLQGYVTQTHIHRPAAALGGIALQDSDTGKTLDAGKATGKTAKSSQAPRDKFPLNDDPAKCPMCQAIGYAGHYVWPAAVVFILPAQAASVVAPDAPVFISLELDSHNWQGRAPPRN